MLYAAGSWKRNLPAKLRNAISAESGFDDGLALPFVVLSVLVLTEPPGDVLGHWPVLALRPLLGPLRKGYDVLFLGWFGPVGAAALYYAAFSPRETVIEEVWVVGSLIICASVLVHGATATPFTELCGRAIRDQ